jgi:hypothetical protein
MPSAGFLTDLITKQATELSGQGKDFLGKGSNLFGKGSDLLGRGVETLGKPLSYYEGLLGNRQEALTAAAPEISTIQGQFDTAARAVSEFTPRGGGRTAASSELPFTKQAAIQDVISKQRPAAAQGITQIGQLLSELGLSEESIANMLSQLGIGAEQSSLQGFEARGDLLLGKSGQSAKEATDLGTAAGVIAAVLI